MKPIETHQRTTGINFANGKAHVCIWAPFATGVALHNETSSAQLLLVKAERGFWYLETDAIRNGDLYKIQIDDNKPLPDPASLSQPKGVHGASEAIDVTAFAWTDEAWRNPELGDYIIYELHVGTFSDKGNFEGVLEKLPYLKELGITAIELMPVAQFPGTRNWGYDGVFPFAVQNSYGGAFGLQKLVDACHAIGIAVILDVVYNHVGPEGNYLNSYGPYFTDKYKTPWGDAINYDDAYCDPVRNFFIENVMMWLRDFHIDALRLDAVHAIKDYSPKHIVEEMNEAVSLYNASTWQNKFLILETDLNDARYISCKDHGGYDVRGQWSDEFHHALRVATGQERTGYFSDFNGLADLAKALTDGYVYTGQYSEERHRNYGSDTSNIPGDRFVVFSQNHDQVGNRMLGERLSHLVSIDMQKLMAAFLLLSPYVPLLFMGQEWAANTPFQYFIHHSDKELIEAVDKGRTAEFAGFQTEGSPPSAQDESTFINSTLKWNEIEDEPHRQLLDFYKQLISLRKHNDVFKNYQRNSLSALADEEKQTLIVERAGQGTKAYCVYNFSKQPQSVALVEHAFPLDVIISSAKHAINHYELPSSIIIHPESALILLNIHVPT